MEPRTDALLKDLLEAREGAFERLYNQFAPKLLRTAYCITRRREDAEDAVQDVFVAVVRAGAALAEVKNLNAYLFTAVHRAAARRAKERGSEEQIDAARIEDQRAGSSHDGEGERLARALQHLPLEQRAVVSLKIDGGLTFDEIATSLNVSLNTAASRYRYALEKLRTSMNAELQDMPAKGNANV